MRIRMLKTVRGSEDGFTARDFCAGQFYDLVSPPRALELALAFVRDGLAETAAALPPAPPDPFVRLPLPAEFVARGYPAEKYQRFIEEETAQAAKRGLKVEIRDLNPDEKDAAAAADAADAASPAATPPPPPPAAPAVAPPPSSGKKNKGR
jgi:hypothetical protein